MPSHQMSLSLIKHEVNNSVIPQREVDGYINATALCKAVGKRWNDYSDTDKAKAFLKVMEAKTGKSVMELIQLVTTAGVKATWVHPKIAVNLGQWISPEFDYQVSEWVEDWISGKGSPTKHSGSIPYHIKRHMLNLNQVPAGYFSVLQEMTFILIGPLDNYGYELPDRMLPDISMGRFLCKHLRDALGVDTDSLPVYLHRFPDGRTVEAKIYPNSYLAEFRRIIQEEWLPKKAAEYFKERDPIALPYLDKVIIALPGPVTAANSPRLNKPKKNKAA